MSDAGDGRGAATYLYAVARPLDVRDLGDLPGVHGGPVRTVELDDLVAVVETVPADEFGQEALDRRLDDIASLERLARAHHAVIETVGRTATAVPLRLASLFRDDDSVRDILRTEGDELRATLDRLDGRREWGVKAYAKAGPPASGSDGTSVDRPASGRDYLRRRREQKTAAEQAQEALLERVSRLDEALSRCAEDVRHLPVRTASADTPGPRRGSGPRRTEAGRGEPNLFNAAYLVRIENDDAFHDEVGRWAADPALRVELAGPWVPYSFAMPAPGPATSGAPDETSGPSP